MPTEPSKADPPIAGPSRRRVLGLLGGALLTTGAAACSAGPVTRIAVPWSGLELKRFREVLDAYGAYTVYSAGDLIGALLDNPVAAAATPDAAIVPRPGLISAACDRIRRLPAGAPGYTPHGPWPQLLACGGETKSVWFKVAHKSLVWGRTSKDAEPFTDVPSGPTQWADWVETVRRAARNRPRWQGVLSIGAADGWVLTDWFENVLLGYDTRVYQRLLAADGDAAKDIWLEPDLASAVRGALSRLQALWRIPGVFPGGGSRALSTTFHDSILDVFQYGRADLVAMGDYALPLIQSYGKHPYRPFRFPTANGAADTPVMVGGDAAVALTPRGTEFIRWLSTTDGAEATSSWVRHGGFISLDPRVAAVPPIRGIETDLQRIRDGKIAFDLSDHLGGGLGGDSGRGLSRIMTRFFMEVTGVDGNPRDAVANAWRAIRTAGTGGRQ